MPKQGAACSCGKPSPEDGGKEGVCECCSTCVADAESVATEVRALNELLAKILLPSETDR